MLRGKARRRPARSDSDDAHRGVSQRGESDRHAEQLAASLAVGSVDLDHDAEAFIRCRTTLSTSTKAYAVQEIRTVSSQSRVDGASVPHRSRTHGVRMTATAR